MMKKLPNLLTWLRILMIPLLVLVFYLPFEWARPASSVLFGIAGLTDWLDGYLARRWQVTSRFGAFLDPVADKLLVATALVLLVDDVSAWWMTLPALVIVSREIAISALREWMAEVGQRARVAVSWLGKVKTTAQIGALLFLLFKLPLPWVGIEVFPLGVVLLYVAALLTLWSMVDYMKAAFPSAGGTGD
ncbi:MAG: CDP-diacylglycerol--glycerol-3-phosphate 3-phosphatidyltransferase [Gammaproteobacteria bacterium]|nr:MAG: CDP-diacylglycerol--glycerol-3-phosphate 3-phosphatidyltransferase [Gammaproteobacteria bacterium]